MTNNATENRPDRGLGAVLRSQAATLRAQADALEALASAVPGAEEALTLAQIRAEYGYGEEAIRAAIARGELTATRGPRQRIEVRRSELERWRMSRPVTPRPRRKSAEVVSLDDWEKATDLQLSRGHANGTASGGRR